MKMDLLRGTVVCILSSSRFYVVWAAADLSLFHLYCSFSGLMDIFNSLYEYVYPRKRMLLTPILSLPKI